MAKKEGQNYQNEEHLHSSRLHHDCKGPAETEEVQHHKMMKKARCGASGSCASLCRHKIVESCHTTRDTVTTITQGVFAKDISTARLKVFCSKNTVCQEAALI